MQSFAMHAVKRIGEFSREKWVLGIRIRCLRLIPSQKQVLLGAYLGRSRTACVVGMNGDWRMSDTRMVNVLTNI